jgi:lycopene cyclase domain-containing protein
VIAWSYLASLVLAIGCMALVDRRWRLVLWAHPGRAAAVLGLGLALFLCWDVVALRRHLYERGDSPVMTGVEALPGLPLEEIFFILFLCYLTLVLDRLGRRLIGAGSPFRDGRR